MKKPGDRYSLGEKLKLKVIEVDEKRRNVVLSEREYVLEQQKKSEVAKDQGEEKEEENGQEKET
jgi:ribosomal protein S1